MIRGMIVIARPRRHRRTGRPAAAAALLLAAAALLAAPPAAARKRPVVVVIYNGFGTTAQARLWGRVLEDRGLDQPRPDESTARKLKRSFTELESDEVPDLPVTIKVLGKSHELKTDKEGLFVLHLAGPLPEGSHEVTAATGTRAFRVEPGRLLVVPRKPGTVVISDIDDTVLQTGVGNKARMLARVLLSNAHDLKTFDGAPQLYQAWARRGYPVVFVSGSPINLYSRLTQFLALRGFPPAALLLKNLGVRKGSDSLTDQVKYKLRRIREVRALLPGYRLILVGDTGEKDPEIYAEVRRGAPDDVVAIGMHRVSKTAPGAPRVAGQLLFDRYPELARALQERGLLEAAEARAVEDAAPAKAAPRR
jgi:phosphatidate phosphatase APP1